MIDLTGQTFYNLTAVRYVKKIRSEHIWLWKCNCGKEIECRGRNVKMGKRKSCGCQKGKSRIKDYTGEKYGFLTAIKYIETKKRQAIWLFKCDCGNTKQTHMVTVKKGYCSSCGCKNKSIPELASFNCLYSGYKDRAPSRGLTFDLSTDDFRKLTSSNCFYCNYPPKQVVKIRSLKTHYTYNGIDRKNNTFGYIMDNCVPCCKICNYSKSQYFTSEEFKSILDKRLENNPEKDPWENFRCKKWY